MMNRVILWFTTAAVLAGWSMGCQSPARTKHTSKPTLPVTARPAPGRGLSPEDINRAAKICVNKCFWCHQLYDPAAYGDTEWQSWVVKMTGKARLKTDQAELMWRYLGAFRTLAQQ